MILSFNGSLASIFNSSDHMKCISLDNQQCMTQPTLITLHPNEYIQGLRYYPFAVDLDRCIGSCNTANDLSDRVCISGKTEDLVLSVFNMIIKLNQLIWYIMQM